MDAFESIVGEILHRDGYWIQNTVKVELTKEEKVKIGRPSSPRWELDLLGYSAKRNELIVVECKSFLDSRGVAYGALTTDDPKGRYKLFNDDNLRSVVFTRLICQMKKAGFIGGRTKLKLALVCGKIASSLDREKLHEYFKQKRWILWDDKWLVGKLREIPNEGYENSQIAVVSKLLVRNTLSADM